MKTNIKSVKDPTKLELTKHRRKSIQTHKRKMSSVNKSLEVTEKVSHCYNFSIKCYHAKRRLL